MGNAIFLRYPLNMETKFLIESSRGSLECRACGSNDLLQALDLGLSPVANSLPPLESEKSENSYPLKLMICRDCFLGQIAEYETPDQIFSSYPYLSSTSSYWVDLSRICHTGTFNLA